mgnify:CR=1 FL=1
MESYFASSERASVSTLRDQFEIIDQNAIIDGLLETVGGMLAVLNKHRQIISLNDSFLNLVGVQESSQALGLRPGEALSCVHSDGEPAGCGTTKYCSTCGAAIAIVSSLKKDKPVENICALKANKAGEEVDIVLQVRSHPVHISGNTYLLIFMQDITLQQQRAALERTFFHDINNMLSGLVGASEILAGDENHSPMVDIVRRSSLRLQKAVEIQRYLLESGADSYNLMQQKISISQIREDLSNLFSKHPVKCNKTLNISTEYEDFNLITDISLMERVLANMITNALEASEEGGSVNVSILLETNHVSFCVQNSQVIPANARRRIFQRNFSTKGSFGRGLGTFSMKLFGEKILGGKVNFISNPQQGTIFTFSLPV